jgi:hypothetical protein
MHGTGTGRGASTVEITAVDERVPSYSTQSCQLAPAPGEERQSVSHDLTNRRRSNRWEVDMSSTTPANSGSTTPANSASSIQMTDETAPAHAYEPRGSSWKADALGDGRADNPRIISWGAVIAGVVTLLALTLLLSLITAALGLGMADFTAENPGEGVGIATGLWSIVTLVLALTPDRAPIPRVINARSEAANLTAENRKHIGRDNTNYANYRTRILLYTAVPKGRPNTHHQTRSRRAGKGWRWGCRPIQAGAKRYEGSKRCTPGKRITQWRIRASNRSAGTSKPRLQRYSNVNSPPHTAAHPMCPRR